MSHDSTLQSKPSAPPPDPKRCPLHEAVERDVKRLEARMSDVERKNEQQDQAVSDLRASHAKVTAIAAFVIIALNAAIMLGLKSLFGG